MKLILVVAIAVVAVAVAAPAEEVAQIVRSSFEQKPDGAYDFGFETNHGIVREETGVVKEVLDEDNKPRPVVTVRGFYSYINKDGTPENINYFADESGYHAEGPSVPKNAEAGR